MRLTEVNTFPTALVNPFNSGNLFGSFLVFTDFFFSLLVSVFASGSPGNLGIPDGGGVATAVACLSKARNKRNLLYNLLKSRSTVAAFVLLFCMVFPRLMANLD